MLKIFLGVKMLVLAMGGLLFAFLPSWVQRGILYGDADTEDYLRFPARHIEKSADTRPLPRGSSLEISMVSSVEYTDTEGQRKTIADPEAFLTTNQTTSFLVVHNGTLVYEKYFNGSSQESIQTSFSVAKSFVSALIGAAIADGAIGSVDDKVVRYIDELRGTDYEKISIKNLMQMSSGIRYDEDHGNDGTITYYADNLRDLILRDPPPVDSPPGSSFLYNNYNPIIEGIILERATHQSVADYLQAKIWDPLGTEFDASWSLDSDRDQFEKMESGINARSRDYAKFGLLYLSDGNYQGRQILPRQWILDSTSMREPSRDYFGELGDHFDHQDRVSYGYHWWGLKLEDGRYDWTARGNYGQFIYVSPKNQVVIVRTGTGFGKVKDWMWILQQIAGVIGKN